MPIQVTCPSCLARFQVSEKFAGKTGPCPKCKESIQVPDASESVVIHEDEGYGPKDSSGRPALKPIEREEAQITPVMIVGIVGAVLLTLIVAWLIGNTYKGSETGVPMWILAIGAVLLGPPLAVAGYAFLRNSELEPHRGAVLWMRAAVCGLVYALLWAGFYFLKTNLFGDDLELIHYAMAAVPMVSIGGLTALASMEMDFVSGAIHYGMYLGATVLLRLLMGIPF